MSFDLLLGNVVGLILQCFRGFMNNVDAENAVRVPKKLVNLLVDEGKCMIDDGHKDHDKDFTEKNNIDTDDVSHEVNPKEDVLDIRGEVFSDEWKLIDRCKNCSVALLFKSISHVLTNILLFFSYLKIDKCL